MNGGDMLDWWSAHLPHISKSEGLIPVLPCASEVSSGFLGFLTATRAHHCHTATIALCKAFTLSTQGCGIMADPVL